jgi:OOP family OmpA-OmpF porin
MSSFVIEGHTDDRGSRRYNQELSQLRAESVRQLMIDEYGIAADRIVAKGFGEDNPIADNNTKEGRAKNRRVVAVIETEVTKEALR